jgi:hypothetical protein
MGGAVHAQGRGLMTKGEAGAVLGGSTRLATVVVAPCVGRR